MGPFTAEDVIMATHIANNEPWPLVESAEMGDMLDAAISPALAGLPLEMRAAPVAMALKTAFAMGLTIGRVLERGS